MCCYLREVELVRIGVYDMATELGSKFMFHGLAAPSPFFVWSLLNPIGRPVNGEVLDPNVQAIFASWKPGSRDARYRSDFIFRSFVGLAVYLMKQNYRKDTLPVGMGSAVSIHFTR